MDFEINVIAPSPQKPAHPLHNQDQQEAEPESPAKSNGLAASAGSSSAASSKQATVVSTAESDLSDLDRGKTNQARDSSSQTAAPDRPERAFGLPPRRRAAPTTFGYENPPKKKRKSEGDLDTLAPRKRQKGEELNDPLTVKDSQSLAPPKASQKRQRSASLTSLSSVDTSVSEASYTSNTKGTGQVRGPYAKRKPSKPSRLSAPPPLEPYDHGCSSEDVFTARIHIREFVIRFQTLLYPKTATVKSKSRSGKFRTTTRPLGRPDWMLRCANSLRLFWSSRDHTRGLIEGLVYVVQNEDCERAKGEDAINAPRVKTKSRSILSGKSIHKFEKLQNELAAAQSSPRTSWNVWMTLEEILVVENYIQPFPVRTTADASDSEDDTLSSLSEAVDGDDSDMDELASQSSSVSSYQSDSRVKRASSSQVASDVDELASSDEESPKPKSSRRNGNLEVSKAGNGRRSSNASRSNISSDLSDISEAVEAQPQLKLIPRVRRNHTPDEKLQLIEAFIQMLISRSIKIKESINDAPNRLIQTRKAFFKLRKDHNEDKAKHVADKPSGPDFNEKVKAWQAELDQKESEYTKNISELYSSLHGPGVRFEVQQVLGRVVYLPTPLGSDIEAPDFEATTPNLESITSSWSLLLRSAPMKPLPIPVHATKKEVEEYDAAVARYAKMSKTERWFSISGVKALKEIPEWLDSECKLRAWERRMAEWVREEPDLIVKGKDAIPLTAEEEIAQEEEERKSKDFGQMVTQFAGFIQTRL